MDNKKYEFESISVSVNGQPVEGITSVGFAYSAEKPPIKRLGITGASGSFHMDSKEWSGLIEYLDPSKPSRYWLRRYTYIRRRLRAGKPVNAGAWLNKAGVEYTIETK